MTDFTQDLIEAYSNEEHKSGPFEMRMREKDDDENRKQQNKFQAAYDQSMLVNCAVAFIWVATSYRMTWRYGERGFRYMLLDAGHVCQNLYLSAENIACGVCAIAAYHDDEFNDLLDLKPDEQFVIYLATVGKKR